jgi:small subunit ribosomal protein S6
MNRIQKHYELYFILDPFLDDTDKERIIENYASFLRKNDGEVDHRISYGLKVLAYKIKKKKKGFCEVFQFRSPGDVIDKLETLLRRDEKVLRFMTSALDKHALLYNKEKREKNIKKEQVEQENSNKI